MFINNDIFLKTKYSKELTKQAVLLKIYLNELMGIVDDDPFAELEGAICNEAGLMLDAKMKNNVQLMEAVHMTRFLSSFWMGDFLEALESSKIILSLPSSRLPKMVTPYFTIYRGIVLLR